MKRSRAWLAVLLAAILGLASAGAEARLKRKRAEPAPSKPAATASAAAAAGAAASAAAAEAAADEAFLQARKAALDNQPDRFEAAAARVGDSYPLRTYVDYGRLRLRMAGAAASGGNGAMDADIQRFLERNAGTVTADLLRRDWLLALGKRAEWATFDEQYPQWVMRDDAQVHCYAWLGLAQRGQPLSREAREALFQPRELGEACGALLETLARNGQVSRADLWRRLKLALEANAPGSARRVGAMLDLPPGAIEAALQRPAKVLWPGIEREVAVIAGAQLARQDPEAAAARIDALRGLPAADRAFVLSQIAAHGMRKLSPQSLDWTREALAAARQIPAPRPAAAAREGGAQAIAGREREEAAVLREPWVSDETLVWMARAALRGSDWKTLNAVVEQMSPEGRRDPTWVYWNARALRALGRGADAETELRSINGDFGFYGQLAAEELGQLTALPPRAPPPTDAEIAEAGARPGLARALKFYDLGLRVEGNREWNFSMRGLNDRQLLAAAEWACRKSVLDRCINAADRTRVEHDFTLRYLTPFREQLTVAAAERGLDPAWVYGLIRQESRFIMDARSSAGAQGLMQIMPPTARWIANRLGVKDFRVEQLGDMSVNLRFGTFYLKNVLEDLDGSPVLASAGYNAGPNRPRNWRATLPATVEGAVFAEIIPFTETRDYVKKVLSNATWYGALLSGQPQSLKARLGSVAPSTARPSELP